MTHPVPFVPACVPVSRRVGRVGALTGAVAAGVVGLPVLYLGWVTYAAALFGAMVAGHYAGRDLARTDGGLLRGGAVGVAAAVAATFAPLAAVIVQHGLAPDVLRLWAYAFVPFAAVAGVVVGPAFALARRAMSRRAG